MGLDKFHAMQLLGRAVDEARRAKHRGRMAETDETLKGTRQLWFMGVKNLGEEDYLRIKELLELDAKVGRSCGGIPRP
jgi:transposase